MHVMINVLDLHILAQFTHIGEDIYTYSQFDKTEAKYSGLPIRSNIS